MSTVKVYHATNTPMHAIGQSKKTMYFTGSWDAAYAWGEDHYPDGYNIFTTELPVSDITVYNGEPGRDTFGQQLADFEYKEHTGFSEKILYMADCCDGYIVSDVNQYELHYN